MNDIGLKRFKWSWISGSCRLVFSMFHRAKKHTPNTIWIWNRMFCSSHSFVIYACSSFLSVCWLIVLSLKLSPLSSCFDDHLECVHSFVASHRLVLLPRFLEVQTAVLSALDDRPSTAGCFHVAIHLHSWHKSEQRSVGKHMYEGNGTLIAPTGLCAFFQDLEEEEFTSKLKIPIFNVTLRGINKQWKAVWTIIWCQTLLFPAFTMNHRWECDVSASSSNLISVSLSLSNSPEMFLIRGPRFCRIKVEVLGVMWPLTLDLGVCKLIMPRLVLYLQCCSLFWGGDPSVEWRRSLTSVSPHSWTHMNAAWV